MYPPEVLSALKDALKHIYWFKPDLRLFLRTLDLPGGVVERQAWDNPKEYKVIIAGKVIDELLGRGEAGLGAMRRLLLNVARMSNFDHLASLEDGPAKVAAARQSVATLRQRITAHDRDFLKPVATNKKAPSAAENQAIQRIANLDALRTRFLELVSSSDPHGRGVLFEGLLRDLFALHDLNPRGSFSITGEQIDGAFELDGTQYLLEAKWEKQPQGARVLSAFAGTVGRRLDNTLGLFVSLEGFTAEGLAAFRQGRTQIILMDGEDLAIVLQGLCDLRDLLKRKVRHAAHTGDPYFRARDFNSS